MASLLETIAGQLGGGMMSQISRQLGADEGATSNAISAALPTLLGALARNTSRPEGAESLHKALAKDHDGGLLDNLGGFLNKAESGPGEGILGHVLGNRRPQVEAAVGKTSGLDAGAVSKLMTMLAPVVLGALGKAQRQSNLDASSLSNMLGQESKRIEQTQPRAAGLLGQLLDSDGDGDVDLGDLAKHGAGILGKFFGR